MSRRNTSLIIGLVSVTSWISGDAVFAQSKTWNEATHFESGEFINLNVNDPDPDQPALAQLEINTWTETRDSCPPVIPYLWVALSGRSTVIRIATTLHTDPITGNPVEAGDILGEYWTAPQRCREYNDGTSGPSRTTVDFDGSVWVANRNDINSPTLEGHVVKIGNGRAFQWIDRNGNGKLDTSTGLGDIRDWADHPICIASDNDDFCEYTDVQFARDELILLYRPVAATGTRTIAVDRQNNVWVGGEGGARLHGLLDGQTGEAIVPFNQLFGGIGGYGGVVDRFGVLWSATNGSTPGDTLLRFDPPSSATAIDVSFSYGLAIDTQGDIWNSRWDPEHRISEVAPGGTIMGHHALVDGENRGVVITPDDNHVWVANTTANHVQRLNANGDPAGTVGTDASPTGVAVDSSGYLWVTNRDGHTVQRINPSTNLTDERVDLPGRIGFQLEEDDHPLGSNAFPYNYSDMTGVNLYHTISPAGVWTAVYDGSAPATRWETVTWDADSGTSGSTIIVQVRAADLKSDLGKEAYRNVGNGVDFGCAVNGQFVQLRVQLNAIDHVEDSFPVMREITVDGTSGLDDCDSSGVADECEQPADCNNDGNTDWCEIANCQGDPACADCNENDVPDGCDVLAQDYNGNNVPDDCEPDCDNNGVADVVEIGDGSPDCNANWVKDECDISAGTSQDCDLNGSPNGIPDECDIATCPTGDTECDDCNNNGIPDDCDITNCPSFDPSCQDCLGGGIPDGCEIADGTLPDLNENGAPDQCEFHGACCLPGGCQNKTRFDCGDEGGVFLGDNSFCGICDNDGNAPCVDDSECGECSTFEAEPCQSDSDCAPGIPCIFDEPTCFTIPLCDSQACCADDGSCTMAAGACPLNTTGRGFGSVCEPNCCTQPEEEESGDDNCNTAPIIVLPVGASPVTVTVAGNTADATSENWHGACSHEFSTSGDPGYWEAFSIDACANVTIQTCCSDPPIQPAWDFLLSGCSCGTFIEADDTFAYTCADGNPEMTFSALPPGTYYYPIRADAGSACVEGCEYQFHVTAKACASWACCLPDESTCQSLSRLDCDLLGGFWKDGVDCSCPVCAIGFCCKNGCCNDQNVNADPLILADCIFPGTYVGGATCDDIICPCANEADCVGFGVCSPVSPGLCGSESCNPLTNQCMINPNVCTATHGCNTSTGNLELIDDFNPCTTDECDPIDGTVTHCPLDEGTPCDDGSPCAHPGVCDAVGQCLTKPINCETDECMADCNHNCVPDDCDIFEVASCDANEDGVPDECGACCEDSVCRETLSWLCPFGVFTAGMACPTGPTCGVFCCEPSGCTNKNETDCLAAGGTPVVGDCSSCNLPTPTVDNDHDCDVDVVEVDVVLINASYGCNDSLPGFGNNVLRFQFAGPISPPSNGEIEIRELLPGGLFGDNLSDRFAFSLEGPVGLEHVLRIEEGCGEGTCNLALNAPKCEGGQNDGEDCITLNNQKWYAVRNVGNWTGVADFEITYAAVHGDANNDLTTDFADVCAINENQSFRQDTPDDSRFDINGFGGVSLTDAAAANSLIPSTAYLNCGTKPTGHACNPLLPTTCLPGSTICTTLVPPLPEDLPPLSGKESVKNRFLSFDPTNPGRTTSIKVTFVSLPPPYDVWDGAELWVQAPSLVSENGASVTPIPGFSVFQAATLGCNIQYEQDWGNVGMIHVFHEGIVPEGEYKIEIVGQFPEGSGTQVVSEPVTMMTAKWGDTITDFNTMPPGVPDGDVGIGDVLAVIGRFRSDQGSIKKARADLEPACLDLTINITDVLASLTGFLGVGYRFEPTAPGACDSTCVNPLPLP